MNALHEALAQELQRDRERYVRPDERAARRGSERRYRHVGAGRRRERGRR